MLKYVNTGVVFQEIPDEVTLAINLSNCPCRCPGCHSQYLWGDVGEVLNEESLNAFVQRLGHDITCIAFMGGDADPLEVNRLAHYLRHHHPSFKVAWYSGRIRLSPAVQKTNFHYLKLGPFIQHLGPLNKPTTNQRLYKISENGTMEDITSRFWKK